MNSPRTPMLLVATVALVAAEALRSSGPTLDRIVTTGGLGAAVLTALIVFALTGLVGPLVAGVGARRAVALAVVSLVVLRLVAQALPVPGLLVGGALAVVGLAALVLLVRQLDAVPAVTGLVLGGAVDVALRTLLMTWDPIWQPGFLAWLVVLAECAALVLALAGAQRRLASDPCPVGRVGLLGGYLGLSVLMFGSPAFVASASGLGLVYAAAALLVGALFAVELLSRSALPGGSGRFGAIGARAGGSAAGALVLGVAVGILTTGVVAALGVMVAQVGAALVLARGLAPREIVDLQEEVDPAEQRAAAELAAPGERAVPAAERAATGDQAVPAAGRAATGERAVPAAERAAAGDRAVSELSGDLPGAGGAGAGGERDEVLGGDLALRPRRRSPAGFAIAGLATGLGYLLVVLAYQVHYDQPLPVPNQVVPILAAVVLGVLALGERPWTPPAVPRHDARAAKRGRLAPLA
ncbi:MAG: hypothetical protein ACRDT2_23975, partial [Natronosporangium sp.]